MESVLHTLAGLDEWVIYVLVGVLVFGESSAILALLFPGELALLVAGALAARGHASMTGVVVSAIVAALLGHAMGYELGRRYGLRLLQVRLLRRYAAATHAAAALVTRYGGTAVFLGRWMNVGRVVVPILVGAGRMRYRSFILYNILGGVTWVATFVAIGGAAGASLHSVTQLAENTSWGLTAVVGIALGALWVRRRSRAGRARSAARRRFRKVESGCPVTVVGFPRWSGDA